MSAKLILGTYMTPERPSFLLPYMVMNYHVRERNNAEVNDMHQHLVGMQALYSSENTISFLFRLCVSGLCILFVPTEPQG